MAPRSMKAAVRAAVNHAQKAGRLRPWDGPNLLLASRLAERLDDADTPRAEWAKLAGELRSVLAALPLVDPAVPGDGDGDDPDAELARLTRSGPEVGDTEDPV